MPKDAPDRLESRQLAPAVELFLKLAISELTLEAFANAFLLVLVRYVDVYHLLGYLWRPARPVLHLALKEGVIVRKEHLERGLAMQPAEEGEDLRVRLHRSLRSLRLDPEQRRALTESNARAAIEIHCTYYGKPLLWVVIGVPSSNLTDEIEQFLILFARTSLVSLHGAYQAEMDRPENEPDDRPLTERMEAMLKWFYSCMRHLHLGLQQVRAGQSEGAEDALERVSIVAGAWMGEYIALLRRMRIEGVQGSGFRSRGG
jgi:hypothetical protein